MLELKLVEADFSRGVVAVSELYEAEVARLQTASVRMRAYLDTGGNNRDQFDRLSDDMRADYPLWWRISGVHFWLGEDGLQARRAGLSRLLGAVETMYRAELALRKERSAIGETASSGEATRAGGSRGAPCFYDPLREICHFIQLPMSKLSQLCLELTGLRVNELGDCVRAEGFKEKMTGLMRPLMTAWFDGFPEKERAKLGRDSMDAAWAFLKWVRGRGRAGNRKKWAWDLGIPTAARLNKAVFQETQMTLEELEVSLAVELVEELLTAPSAGVDCARSADLSDVGGRVGEVRVSVERVA